MMFPVPQVLDVHNTDQRATRVDDAKISVGISAKFDQVATERGTHTVGGFN